MIYLDANASSKLRPEAVTAISKLLENREEWANPSSVHRVGQKSRKLLAQARTQVNSFLTRGTRNRAFSNKNKPLPSDITIFFTSGGTESCCCLVHGFLSPLALSTVKPPIGHLISTSVEHPAMLKSLSYWAERGWDCDLISPRTTSLAEVIESSDCALRPDHFMTPEQVLAALRPDTSLVSIMLANNETGAIFPVEAIACALRNAGYKGAIISDITQALGKAPCDISALFEAGVDAVALSGHKLGAPTGVGVVALRGCRSANDSQFVCKEFAPLFLGGGQESGLRSGTENLLGIVALGAVVEALDSKLEEEISLRRNLRLDLFQRLRSVCGNSSILTPFSEDSRDDSLSALCNTLFMRFPGCRADDLVVALDLAGVAISAGSACHSGKQSVSPVLKALGVSEEIAREFVRISLDWDATAETIKSASEIIGRVVAKMRSQGQESNI